jgi:hypothetical protein
MGEHVAVSGWVQKFVVAFTLGVAFLILVLCVWGLVKLPDNQEVFGLIVKDTLLPLFNAFAASVLTYVLGVKFVSALSKRRTPENDGR